MEVRLSDLIFHNRYWMYLVRTSSNEPRFLLMPRNRNLWFTPLTYVKEHAWNFHLRVVQASFMMDDLFTNDCSIKNAHSSILALVPLVQGSSKEMYSLMLFFGRMLLCQWLGVLRVTILLVTSHVDSFFQGVCHVSPFGWSCRFRCPSLLPKNSRIPPLLFTFMKFFLLWHLSS